MNQVLQVKNVSKYYTNKTSKLKVLDEVSFEVEENSYIGIMGTSGSGKTTLLNCIATIDEVTEGDIWMEGQNITELDPDEAAEFRKEKLGFIFQEYNLIDSLTAYENIALALSIRDVAVSKIDDLIKGIARRLDILEVLNQYPYQLSGGQKQRVACARAVITNPKLILADEPTGALDSRSAELLMKTMQYINRELGATILMVTHDPACASYCDKIIFIKDGKMIGQLKKGTSLRVEFLEKIHRAMQQIGRL